MGLLSKTSTVMNLAAEDLVEASFYQDLEDEHGVARTASFSYADFHDMGNPKTITVTVVPGDTLNDVEN